MPKRKNTKQEVVTPSTRVVSAEVFKRVYDSPHSLPGKEKWVTNDYDVREIERF
ncbi:hypothetical protein [Devosia sp.]|uniref:hypothetical protein n=1 Tax=Devosia sp. TaxID=1871048 RepID=UPI002736BF3F|nr:hypothetical protein [Devosia sp.]